MNLTQSGINSQELIGSIIDRLEKYVAIESPSGDKHRLDALGNVIAADFQALGASISYQEHASGNHVIIDMDGAGDAKDTNPILFLTHHDTVWPVGQLELMPFTIENGVLYGPGTFDMKAGIAVLVEALTLIKAGMLPHRAIRVMVVADEEVGSPTARELIESQAGRVEYALGLEPPHPNGDLKTARWGSTRLRLEVVGKESHAALDPDGGISAIDELVDQLVLLRSVVAEYPGVLCNVGTVTGGGRTNVVPGKAIADVGLRFKDAAVEAQVLARLLAPTPVRDGARVQASLLSNRPAWTPSELHDGLLAQISAAAAEVGQTLGGSPATGAADTNVCGWLGIPTLDGLGPVGKGAHAITEQLSVESLGERARLLAAIITAL